MATEFGIKIKYDGKEATAGAAATREQLAKIGSDGARAGQQAAAGLVHVGNTAKQTANAMRGVPAQFTDIFVSLQAGQRPMQVLLQQGGQLKDMFGGIGPAAKALGGYVVGLINPLTLAAAGVATLGYAYLKGSQEAEAYARSIILSGNAAGVTVSGLTEMAEQVAATAHSTTSAAAEALATFTANGNIAAGQLEKFSAVALRLQRETGAAVEDTVKQFTELGKDPVSASQKLNETTHFLTLAVYEQIKALDKQGDAAGAAKLAQESYAEVMNTRMDELQGNLGTLETALRSITDVAKSAWDAIWDVGRKPGTGQQIKELENQIKAAEGRNERLKNGGLIGGWLSTSPAELAALRAKIVALKDLQTQEEARAGQSAKEAAAVTKQIALDKESTKGRSASTRAGVDQYKQLAEALDRYLAQLEAERAASGKLSRADEIEVEIKRKLSAADQARLAQSVARARQIETELELRKQMQAFEEEAIKQAQERADTLAKSAAAIQAEALKIREHTAELGLNKVQIEALHAARDADLIALKEHELAELDATGQCTAYSEALRDNIAALKERRNAASEQSVKQVAVDAAADAEKAWKDFYTDIERGLTDSLYRSFEAGKGFGETFVDGLKNLFKTTVLKIAVQGVVQGGLSAAGIGGGASASSLGSVANAGSSLFQLGGSGLSSGFLSGFASAGSEAALGAAFVGPSATLAGGAVGAGANIGSLFGSAASSIASALPLIGGAVAIAGLLGAFGKKAAPSQGATATSSLVGGNYSLTGLGSGTSDKYNADLAGPAEAINKQYLSTLSPLFEALGSQQALSFTTSLHTRGDGKQYAGFSSTTGDSAVDGMVLGFGKIASSEAIAKATEFALGAAISQAIVASDLAEPIRKLFVDVTDSVHVGELVSGLTTLAGESAKLNDVWGIAIEQAAAVASATGAAGTALGSMAGVINSLKSQGEIAAATYDKLSSTFASLSDAAYPQGLEDYDAAMKGVDTTTQKGIETFAALLSMRGDFATFTAAINQVKTGVNDAVFDLRSASEQAAINQRTLADAAKTAGVQVPTTAAELVKMADAIDYTKKAGIDLALALPGLVAAFKAAEVSATAAAGAERKAEVAGRRAQQQAQTDASRAGLQAAKEASDTLFADIKAGIAKVDAWLKSSLLGGDSVLSPEQKIAAAQDQFNAIYQKAAGGDSEAISQLTTAADALQTAARDGLASSPAYVAIWNDIQAKLGSLGDGSQFSVEGQATARQQQSLAEQDAYYQNMVKDYRYQALDSWSGKALSAGYSPDQVSMIKSNAFWQGNVANGGGNAVDWEGSLVDPAKFDDLYYQIKSDNLFTKKSLVSENEEALRRVVNTVVGVIPTGNIIKSLEANGQASTGGLLEVINELKTLNNSTDAMVANNRLGVVA